MRTDARHNDTMGKKRPAPIVPASKSPHPAAAISKRQLKVQRRQQRQEVVQSAPKAQSQHEPPSPSTPHVFNQDQFQMANNRCWDPEISHSVSVLPPSLASAAEPLAREIARGAALRRLRLSFSEAVRGLQLTSPLVGAFERWHFGWLLGARASAAAFDPLLPAAVAQQPAADADGALHDELVDSGASSEAATATVAALRASAEAEATAMATATSSASAPPVDDTIVELSVAPDNSSSGGGGKVWHVACAAAPGPPLKLSDEWLAKLRAMHERATAVSDEPAFRVALVRLLLRYKALGGSGFQAALGGGTFEVLRSCFGASVECCASPLNARSTPFCSAFLDVDAPFGSLGSFLDLSPTEGAYEANPPFVPLFIAAMTDHMETLLRRAETAGKALLFAVVVGTSAALKRHAAWAHMQRIAGGAFGRAQWLVPLHAHGYTEGHAHIARGGSSEARRMSSCDTTVFIWATSAASARWPAGAEAEAALRAAMRAMVPKQLKRATKANKNAALAKKQKRVAAS